MRTGWLPSHRAARRCGAKMLKAHRSGQVNLSCPEEMACLDVCLQKHLRPTLRRYIGKLWLNYGEEVILKARETDETAYAALEDPVNVEMLRALSA
jgi:hypothetical protein